VGQAAFILLRSILRLHIRAQARVAANATNQCISAVSLSPDTRIQPRRIKACGNPRPAALIQIKSQVHQRLPQKRGYASGASFPILMSREKSGAPILGGLLEAPPRLARDAAVGVIVPAWLRRE
jgi:hypothetical protein